MTSIDPSVPDEVVRERAHVSIWWTGLVAGAAWAAVAALIELWPEIIPQPYGRELAIVSLLIALVLVVVAATGKLGGKVSASIRHYGPWFVAAALIVAIWEVVTAKTGLLPLPFFSSPQSILEVFLDDWQRLGISVFYSVLLLAKGYFFGALAGFLTGVTIGWSRSAAYWVHPVLRLIGPLPATAWLPLAFFIFPSSGSASVFLIALATAFPVTILTWSGIASVNRDYYDIARTLGAKPLFLILKVAIPSALPHVFVGLFMGLGTSFAVLVVAEMLGVKAGLGWYLQWAQGWAAYANMYAALLVMALMCSTLITLLFRIRDWSLSWQKGLVRW
ncbi:ABC transporter permease subunit [Rhizobium daejeonense]|uniref:ABC transporter permease subunit n=1 Tax=Rhizobium daejeonense TaxID=240521 RepID=A0A6M1SIG9_9HYPH|nr:ABC transporter permease subunit [Rhizobium daejeonense]NGO66606.1 ABC transporter permease subunit [Rhizobium daejeonense]